uniref:FUN14 domain-containing protein n=1 Tax=Trichobilharzia regenti TaxID=157069 RepID=A0AA85JLI3_TRIRE|nr:unnamed protein product [Trichobilharzia regenti]
MRAEDGERAIVAVQDTLNSIKSRPHRQQVLMGVSSGLVAGYIFAKIGRAAALLLGGTLIALQCAVQQDIIHINWRKVQYAGDRLQSSTPIFGDKVSSWGETLFRLLEKINSISILVKLIIIIGLKFIE